MHGFLALLAHSQHRPGGLEIGGWSRRRGLCRWSEDDGWARAGVHSAKHVCPVDAYVASGGAAYDVGMGGLAEMLEECDTAACDLCAVGIDCLESCYGGFDAMFVGGWFGIGGEEGVEGSVALGVV